jgi:hypothetical protein
VIKYSELNLGQIEAVVNKIGGMSGVQRLLADDLVVVEKSNLKPVVTGARDFGIWKTVTLGLKKSPKDYRKAIEKDGNHIGDYAGQILNKTEVSQTEVELDLVVVTVGELGFKDGARRDKIYARAIELGLQICPAEVGPALRLLYKKDQPSSEWLRIAMEPIVDSGDSPRVFSVDDDYDDRWLLSAFGNASSFWHADDRWVFVRPRK